jgi:hypothetical protein
MIILIIIFVFILLFKSHEYFISFNEIDNNTECCLVEKVFVPYKNTYGKFQYKYTKLKGNKCKLNNNNITNKNKEILINNKNGWSNKNCHKNNKIIGSCRNSNKECVDFVTNEFCDKYNMIWNKKTCNEPLDYVWVDLNPIIKPKTNKNSFIMFDSQII